MKPKIYLTIFLISFYLACISQTTKVSLRIIDGIQDNRLKTSMEQNSSILLTRLNEAFLKNLDEPQLENKFITPEGIESIRNLWEISHFRCLKKQISEFAAQKGDVYQIRNIPIILGDTDSTDVIIEYHPDGRVSDIIIALQQHQYKHVLDATDVSDRTRREIILGFLENFRTAYVKKDIDYIKKLYHDEALIITGKVLKTENISSDSYQSGLTKDQIKYQVQTKAEYLAKLKNVFSNIQYLKLDFKNISVEKHRKNPNFYGIQLRQIWDASNYKDDGLLFLLVQFKDNEDPIIWVRTWQDAAKTPKEEEFGFKNFIISSSSIK